MKAFYKIHDKPRGRWQPLLEWGVSFSPQEKKEADELNLDKTIAICYRSSLENEDPEELRINKYIGKVCPKNYILLPFLKANYTTDSNRSKPYMMGNNGCCSESCFFKKGRYYRDGLTLPFVKKFHLEWRPGQRPDYSDYIEPLRIFLYHILTEIERRFAEIRESTSSDEWFLEDEFDLLSWNTTKSGVEIAEKKLRVIRK